MTHNKYTIKDGEIIITTTIKIDDYSKLLRFNKNLYYLAYDIKHSRLDEHFENFLLKAEELFAEEVNKAKPRESSPLGKHSIFYYMYGHMNDWVKYAEKEVIHAKALFTQACRIVETIHIIKNSISPEDAANNLMDALGLDEIGARYVVDQRLSVLTGIRPDAQKECIEFFEKRLSIVKELAKYDR